MDDSSKAPGTEDSAGEAGKNSNDGSDTKDGTSKDTTQGHDDQSSGTSTNTQGMINPADFEPNCATGTTTATLEQYIETLCQRAFSCCEREEYFSLFGSKISTAVQCKDALLWTASQNKISGDGLAQLARIDKTLAALVYGRSETHSEVRGACLAECLEAQKTVGCQQGGNNDHCAPGISDPGQACDPARILRPKLKAGDPCSSDLAEAGMDTQCEYGLDCLELNGKYSCTVIPTEGQACTPSRKNLRGNCEHGLYCHSMDLICKSAAQLGQACDTESDTAYKPCVDSLGCDKNKVCVASCQDGASCRDQSGKSNDDLCPASYSCHPGKHPRCLAPNMADGACDSDADCFGNLYCDSATKNQPQGSSTTGACKAPGEADTDCLRNAQCVAGTHCSEATAKCTADLAANEACAHSKECPDSAPYCALVDIDTDGNGLATPTRICTTGAHASSVCAINDSGLQDSPKFMHLLREAFTKAQPSFKPWLSLCKSGGCEGDANSATCKEYAAAEGACNHVAGDMAPNCAPGYHCVAGKCKAFRELGEACDMNSSNWKASDATFADGFPSPICNPDHARCEKSSDMSFRCLYVGHAKADKGFCDGKDIQP